MTDIDARANAPAANKVLELLSAKPNIHVLLKSIFLIDFRKPVSLLISGIFVAAFFWIVIPMKLTDAEINCKKIARISPAIVPASIMVLLPFLHSKSFGVLGKIEYKF